MISGKCQLYAKNGEIIEKAQYFEDKQFPESKSTHQKEERKNVFPVNVTSTNTRDTFPSAQCLTQYASENHTNRANKEENNIQKATFDEKLQLEGNTQSTCHRFRTSFSNSNFSHNPQLIQQQKGNPCNLQFTHRKAIKANPMCSMLSDLNATMIQPANTALFLRPFFNFNQFEFLISVPHIYQFIPQHPHYHCILFQPFSGILSPPQTMHCQYCQPRVEYCPNLCMPFQSQKVPVITKEFIKESSSESAQSYRLDSKNVRKSMPSSVHLKQKDKHIENKSKVDEYQIPHVVSSMMNYPTIQSKHQGKSEHSSSQSFKNWKRSSKSKMEHQSQEMNVVEQRISSSENSTEDIHNIKCMNPKFPDDDTLSNDTGDKRKLNREGEKSTELNLNAKLIGERPVIYQNGIQEMYVTTSQEDKNGKEDLYCKSHSYKQVHEVWCPSIRRKVNKNIESKDTQLKPEEVDQIRELIASYSPLTVEKTKAIVNLVFQQLLENRGKNNGEDNATQNLQTGRKACNNYMDSQRKYCMKIKDDGGQIINYNDKEKAFIPSTSQRNPMNEKEEANVSNKMSTQSCSSTTFKQAHFVQTNNQNFSSIEFNSESGIDTD